MLKWRLVDITYEMIDPTLTRRNTKVGLDRLALDRYCFNLFYFIACLPRERYYLGVFTFISMFVLF